MKQALADAVDSAEKRKAIVEAQSVDRPLEAAQRKLKRERIQKAMHGSRWYKAQQAAASGSALEVIAEEVAPVVGQTITIKPAKDDGKALEVLAGTDRLCLGDYNPLDKNQQWIAKENCQLQHVATGLFLDSEVKYLHLQLGQPWESCGSALRVKPADADSGRQLWTVPRGSVGGMIRHIFDGRVLDINHHEVKLGSGVNVNVPHSFRQSDGFTWSSHEVDTGEAADACDGAPFGMARVAFDFAPADTGLSWSAAADHASLLGARLPTPEEFKKVAISTGGFDQWLPASGGECRWVQTGDAGRIYAEEGHPNGGWYDTDSVEEWRPTSEGTARGSPVHSFYVFYDSPAPSHMSGEWYTIERSSGERNGDEYEFRGEKGHYLIYRHGKNDDGDAFTVEGTTITHDKGPTAEVQPNGDIFWDIDGGKWASRRKVLGMAADTDIPHIGGSIAPIDPEFADGSSFIMTVAADQRFCIAVAAPDRPKCARPGCNFLRHSSQGHDYCCNACKEGQDHGPACERNVYDAGGTPRCVCCQKVKADVDPKQCWRLIDGDRLQNVETGDFLSTETKYAFVANVDAPWDGNSTDLMTRARDDGRLTSNSQRWVFTAENGLPSTSADGLPLHIEVRGAGAGWASEGPWILAADRHDGRPVWRRKANPDNDTISWFQEEGKWKLCGTGEVCYYEADSDTALPPKDGWVSKGQIDVHDVDAGAAPTLHYSLDGQPVTDGRVLRHRLDGRAVDIHGWRFFDGAKMGVENSAHSDLKGVSYKFISPPLAVAALVCTPQQQALLGQVSDPVVRELFANLLAENAALTARVQELERGAANAGDSGTKNEGWFVVCDGDFHGGDSGQEECANVAAADAMVLQKPAASSVAYQFFAPFKALFTKPVGHNGEGEWRQQNPSDANLYLYGKDTGHRAGGKTLVAVQDVDLCFGDGQVDNGVVSYDEALARAVAWERTDSAAFWHTPSQRLIEKPKGNGCKWDHGDGVLFVWMDRFVGPPQQGKTEKSVGTVATPALAGEWYTVERSSGERNGDKYQFRGEKGHYKILPRGRLSRAFIRVFADRDEFSVEGTTIKLGGKGTAAAEVQQNGEIFWARDGGKWASRREGGDHEASANGAWTLVREDSTGQNLGSSVFVTLPVMACGGDAKVPGLSFHDIVQADSKLEGRWSHPQHGSGEFHGSVEDGKLQLHFPAANTSYVYCRS